MPRQPSTVIAANAMPAAAAAAPLSGHAREGGCASATPRKPSGHPREALQPDRPDALDGQGLKEGPLQSEQERGGSLGSM